MTLYYDSSEMGRMRIVAPGMPYVSAVLNQLPPLVSLSFQSADTMRCNYFHIEFSCDSGDVAAVH
jgi:hypothetical protein